MSTTIKSIIAICALTVVAACAQQEEVMVVEEPVMAEEPMGKL